jgi:oligosaccharide repeat unit polymerase
MRLCGSADERRDSSLYEAIRGVGQMLILNLCLFGLSLIGFLLVWYFTTKKSLTITPFVIFGIYEIAWGWPATIYEQYWNQGSEVPATLMGCAFLNFLIGFLFLMGIMRETRSRTKLFTNRALLMTNSPRFYAIIIGIICLVNMLLAVMLYGGLPPLFEAGIVLFRGGGYIDALSVLTEGREEITKGYYFGGQYRGQGVISQVLQVGWVYVTGTAWLIYYRTKRRNWLFLSLLLLAGSLILGSGVGGRLVVAMPLVCLIILVSLTHELRLKGIAKIAVIMCLIVAAVTPLSSQTTDLEESTSVMLDTLQYAVGRVAFGSGMTNIEVYDFIENGSLEVGYGRIHIEKSLTALPGVTVGIPFSYEVQLLRKGYSLKDTSFASMTYFGILYADFGAIGVLIGYLLIGCFTAIMQYYFVRVRKGILEMPAVALMIYYFSFLSIGSSISAVTSIMTVGIFYIIVKGGALCLRQAVNVAGD